jgi:N utilization substance protein A
MKGSRVQAIIRELHGEKIDIIAYSDDPAQFAMNALSPAKISRASILDPVERHLEVIVETDQLSLAIGKKGQNVRLAAKLTGWRIDIKSDEEKRAEIEDQMAQMAARTPLSELPGFTPSLLQKLTAAGIETIEQLADTPIAQLTDIKGVGPKSAEKIIASVKDYYMQSEATVEEGPVTAEETSPGSEVSPEVEKGTAEGTEPAKMDTGTETGSSHDTELVHEVTTDEDKKEEE